MEAIPKILHQNILNKNCRGQILEDDDKIIMHVTWHVTVIEIM